MDEQSMTAIAAINHVMEYYGIASKYALAKELTGEGLNVQPIQIDNYLSGVKMSSKVANRFKVVFDITIEDVFTNRKPWLYAKDGIV